MLGGAYPNNSGAIAWDWDIVLGYVPVNFFAVQSPEIVSDWPSVQLLLRLLLAPIIAHQKQRPSDMVDRWIHPQPIINQKKNNIRA
jgi:hypothetical protein